MKDPHKYEKMIVTIVSDYETSLKVAKRLHSHNVDSVGVEIEFGSKSATIKDVGYVDIFNHHSTTKNPKQPSLAFNETNKYESFIISHIDADTIFGIGWLSGYFDKSNSKLLEISTIISEIDNNGIHKIDQTLIDKYAKELEVIFSVVSEAKAKLNKLRYSGFYNCTPIVKKTILKIIDHIQNQDLLDKKYSLIKTYKGNINASQYIMLKHKHYQVFSKKINNFKEDNHSFIVIYNTSISVFGRDFSTTLKYFPEGLPEFLEKIIPGSGGHFSAVGSPRAKNVSSSQFSEFIKRFTRRINAVSKREEK